ncbi:MAG: serine/threonine protein kinase, partial [Phycisphaerales bacterium]|nr:serine/threonine protein kinase [Phycisphaerales bacterium]
DVAVKFLLNVAPGDESRLDDVLAGVRATAALTHPNLNAVFHADQVAGVPYLVMEFVNGPTLSQVIKRSGPLPSATALVALREIAAAIIALHERGIVHRDIKPANVLIERDGRTQVTDFGLACKRQLIGLRDQPVEFAGTPAYMAPEMFDGQISPKSDVYALGITLFEILTGALPFTGALDEIAQHQRSTPLPVERLKQHGCPDALIDVIERATHKNHIFRLKSAAHLLNALENAELMPPRGQTASGLLSRYLAEAGPGDARGDQDHGSGTPPTAYYDTLASAAAKKRAHRPSIPPPPPLEP